MKRSKGKKGKETESKEPVSKDTHKYTEHFLKSMETMPGRGRLQEGPAQKGTSQDDNATGEEVSGKV